jgi:NitT/TauT family transport system substrate-binding protein
MPARLRNLLMAVTAGLVMAGPVQAWAEDLKKVTIAAGAYFLDDSYPWLMMPLALEFWKKAGYDVEVFPAGGSVNAMQQLVTGNADFAQINSMAVIQANTESDMPVRALMANGIVDWQLIVPDLSAVTEVTGLEGKTIGVPSLSSGGTLLLKAYLEKNGLTPGENVDLVPIGIGTAALEAIQSGKVDAAMFWAGMVVIFENQGATFRKFRDADWDNSVDYTFAAMQGTIDEDPEMVEAIVRGANMATVFAMTNPLCSQQIHWAKWPEAKPEGPDEETISKWDLNNLNAQLSSMKAAHERFGGGEYWGKAIPEPYGAMQEILFDQGVIQKKVDPAGLIVDIPEFWKTVNDFDASEIEAMAKACSQG